MTAAPRLHELQQGFADAMLRRDESVAAWVEGAGLEPTARLRVYRNAIAGTLHAALRDAYPVVLALVGEGYFEELSERYRLQYPSTSGNLQHFGATMAQFIEETPSLRALPYLPDVARLEWLRQGVALAAEQPTMDAAALAHWATCEPAALRMEFHPSMHLLASSHAVLTLWRWCQAPHGAAPNPQAGAEHVLLWRDDGEVAMAAVDPATFRCIGALAEGCDLASAYRAATDVDPYFDVQTCLQDLLAHRLVVSLSSSRSV
jgi:hypothetical protein